MKKNPCYSFIPTEENTMATQCKSRKGKGKREHASRDVAVKSGLQQGYFAKKYAGSISSKVSFSSAHAHAEWQRRQDNDGI
ncbi:MAG: hypothetical protein WBC29_00125 [Candidatus Moraniibacteriota bacterium]